MKLPMQQKPISEDGVRSLPALGDGHPIARFGDWAHSSSGLTEFGYSHNVSHPARWRRIVVWALSGNTPEAARGRKNVCQEDRSSLRTATYRSPKRIYRFKTDTGRLGLPTPDERIFALAGPTVCQALSGAPVASPQSRILHREQNQSAPEKYTPQPQTKMKL
jgi:hypothetical protein